jgi:hypothetical protein
MKQTLVLGLFSFTVATAGATWFAAVVAPPRPLPDRISPTAVAPAATVRSPAARPVADPPRGDPSPGAPVDSGPASRPTDPVLAPRGDTAAARARAKAVAKILASMKPKEAASIIAKLTDDEVELIVRQLNPKQVAALWAVVPEDRAAGLSRRLLQPVVHGGTSR